MPRPKKIELNEEGTPVAPIETVDVPQPEVQVVAPLGHLRPQVERQSSRTSAMVYSFPRVIGGVCEACGVIDGSKPSHQQYKLCPHYRHVGQLQCSYCSELVNPDDVIYHQPLTITSHPDNPLKLVVRCGQYDCLKKHEDRFRNKL
jgi:hypothetical protein